MRNICFMLLLQTCSFFFPSWGTSSDVVALASPPSGVAEGGALRLACCSLAAASQAHYTWIRSTSTSASLSPSYNGQVWNINQVTSDNSGTFYCQIHTGDQVQKSAPLILDVECRLNITFMRLKHHVNLSLAVCLGFFSNSVLKLFNVSSLCSDSPRNTLLLATEEQPATLTCSSDANPPVQTYSWYEGAACLPSADRSFHPVRHSAAVASGPGGTNTAASLTPVENGLHCCEARNRHGSQSYSLTVMSSSGMAIWGRCDQCGSFASHCRKTMQEGAEISCWNQKTVVY